jgi:hypothetical protein
VKLELFQWPEAVFTCLWRGANVATTPQRRFSHTTVSKVEACDGHAGCGGCRGGSCCRSCFLGGATTVSKPTSKEARRYHVWTSALGKTRFRRRNNTCTFCTTVHTCTAVSSRCPAVCSTPCHEWSVWQHCGQSFLTPWPAHGHLTVLAVGRESTRKTRPFVLRVCDCLIHCFVNEVTDNKPLYH